MYDSNQVPDWYWKLQAYYTGHMHVFPYSRFLQSCNTAFWICSRSHVRAATFGQPRSETHFTHIYLNIVVKHRNDLCKLSLKTWKQLNRACLCINYQSFREHCKKWWKAKKNHHINKSYIKHLIELILIQTMPWMTSFSFISSTTQSAKSLGIDHHNVEKHAYSHFPSLL